VRAKVRSYYMNDEGLLVLLLSGFNI